MSLFRLTFFLVYVFLSYFYILMFIIFSFALEIFLFLPPPPPRMYFHVFKRFYDFLILCVQFTCILHRQIFFLNYLRPFSLTFFPRGCNFIFTFSHVCILSFAFLVFVFVPPSSSPLRDFLVYVFSRSIYFLIY